MEAINDPIVSAISPQTTSARPPNFRMSPFAVFGCEIASSPKLGVIFVTLDRRQSLPRIEAHDSELYACLFFDHRSQTNHIQQARSARNAKFDHCDALLSAELCYIGRSQHPVEIISPRDKPVLFARAKVTGMIDPRGFPE